MAARRARAWLTIALVLATPVALAGCASDEPPPQSFAPLTYAYLRPLRLNVGSVDVQSNWVPGAGDVSSQSPAVPLLVLEQMGRDRLVPAGASGRAVFTVQQASITDAGGTLNGLFRVRLDIYTSDGQRAAYAEAAVARTAPAPDDDDSRPAALYGLTKQMMSDMNVELEFQLRRSIGDWLQTGPAAAPPPVAVHQEPLAPPGTTSSSPSTGGPVGFRFVPPPPPAQ